MFPVTTYPENGKPRILLVAGAKGDTRRYRLFHAFEQLKLTGVPSCLADITTPGLARLIPEDGLVILHRVPFDGSVDKLLTATKAWGSLVIGDIDDLLFDPAAFEWIDSPDFQNPVRSRLYQEEMRRHRTTLEACDAIIASTDYLAECARPLGKKIWVLRNAFSQEMLVFARQALQRRSQNGSRIVLGYASGTPTHDRDFARVAPTLLEILSTYPQVEVWLLGPVQPGDGWGRAASRLKLFKRVDWRQLPDWLARFDINLAPLQADNPFSQSKSEIKYVEAGLVKTPTIASASNAFQFAIRHGENGLLARGESDWRASLLAMVAEAGMREQLGEQAHLDVLQRYHPAQRAAERITVLNEMTESIWGARFWDGGLAAHPGEGPPGFTVGKAMDHNPSNLRRGLYTLRYRGAGTLAAQVWILIRRRLAAIAPFRRGQ